MIQEADFDKDLWNTYVLQQEELCNKLGIAHTPVDPYQILGLSANTTLIPINGLRHPSEQSSAGWYIWSGEYSVANDFFQPVHAYHLLSTKPGVIKYLGLPTGFRFLIDDEGYEDIWYDETLLNI